MSAAAPNALKKQEKRKDLKRRSPVLFPTEFSREWRMSLKMTDNPKLLSLLGMCRKAGKLSCGHDAAIGSVRSKSARLCLLSSDASERLRKETEREASFGGREIPVRTLFYTMEEIGKSAGLKSAVVTVNDEGFAKTMLGLLDNNWGG